MLLLLFACIEPTVNQPPIVTSITISPEPSYNDSILICSANVSDPEDDLDEYYRALLEPSYKWMKDDVQLNSREKINLGNFELEPTDTLTCVVSISDFWGLTAEGTLDVTLDNRPPTLSNLQITPLDVYNDSELTCSVDAFDPDGDIELQYAWVSGSIPLGNTRTIDISDAGLRPTDSVSCSVFAEDPYGETAEASESIILQNRPPTEPTATISWLNGGVLYPNAESDVICSTSLATDPDGDHMIYSSIWTSDSGVEVIGSRLFSNYTSSREVWTCDITVSDGDLGSTDSQSIMIRDFDWENCSSSHNLDEASYHFIGENENDAAGYWVSSAGDVDGDGLADILIGAPNNDDGALDAGKAYLVLGRSLQTEIINLSEADYSFVGENIEDFAGLAVASAGDVDGDGLDDILINSRVNDDGGNDAGKVYLILASSLDPADNIINLGVADYKFVGENEHDVAGWSIASAGDVDGDGLSDMLISAIRSHHGIKTDVGKIYLVLGASLGSFSTIDLSYADYVFIGEAVDDWAGSSVSSAGDVDGDGLDDILIGADGADDGGDWSGKAYLILASSIDWSSSEMSLEAADHEFMGDEFDRAGTSVSSAGDVDGDGLDDILIGADGDYDGGFHAGKTYLVLGASLGLTTMHLPNVDYEFIGAETDLAGSSVSSAGDVNDDGFSDIIIGAPGNNDGGYAAGKTYLMLGASLGAMAEISLSDSDYSLIGEEATSLTGSSVSGVGDVNGDGVDDILIGSPNNPEGGDFAGKVSVFTGCY